MGALGPSLPQPPTRRASSACHFRNGGPCCVYSGNVFGDVSPPDSQSQRPIASAVQPCACLAPHARRSGSRLPPAGMHCWSPSSWLARHRRHRSSSWGARGTARWRRRPRSMVKVAAAAAAAAAARGRRRASAGGEVSWSGRRQRRGRESRSSYRQKPSLRRRRWR
jgi:hypothetical protein